MRARFLHYRSFWLGVPIFLFLVWGWVDSVRYDTRANLPHGPAIKEMSKLPAPIYYTAPQTYDSQPDLLVPSFDISSVPEDRPPLPLMPYNYTPPKIVDPQMETRQISVQPTISIGNREGAVWISKWNTPDLHKERWERLKIAGKPPWVAGFLYQAGESAPTLWLPHWLLITAYTLPWAALVYWRHLRRRVTLLPADTPA